MTTKFTIRYHRDKGIRVSPHGGNDELQPGKTIEWECSEAGFRLRLYEMFGGSEVPWSAVFSTPEPAWDVSQCSGTIHNTYKRPFFKYAVIIGQDTLDPVIIVGGKQRKSLVVRVLTFLVGVIAGAIGIYVTKT